MTARSSNAGSDRDLVVRVRRGEVDAYGDLVRLYQTSVFNVCYRLLGERGEAEDMTQDTFIRAYQRIQTFDIERPFGPWIRRVAANLCLNQLQKKFPAQTALEEEFALMEENWPGNPEASLENQERTDAIREALRALPVPFRAVIELRHFQEMDYEEIAQALHLPLNTVKSHLFRARKLLAQRLQNV
jgi:RNA polymerase sigma-70 factor (ECF subfamily)